MPVVEEDIGMPDQVTFKSNTVDLLILGTVPYQSIIVPLLEKKSVPNDYLSDVPKNIRIYSPL